MERRTSILTAACIGVIAAGMAPAGAQQISPQLRDIIRAPQHRDAVIQAAQQSSSWVNRPCASAAFTIADEIAIYRQLEVDAQAKPMAGAWKESVIANGFGERRVLNVLTAVQSPGALSSSVMLPGTTRADPLPQRDAVRYAVAAVGGAIPDCRQQYVADTKFVGFEGSPDPGLPAARRVAPWKEEWTMVRCEKRSIATLHFAPTPTGTTITASPGETK